VRESGVRFIHSDFEMSGDYAWEPFEGNGVTGGVS
jgi:hypothetical protein